MAPPLLLRRPGFERKSRPVECKRSHFQPKLPKQSRETGIMNGQLPPDGWSGWLFRFNECRNNRLLDTSAIYERTEMMKKLFMFVAALSLALFATSAFAQSTTTGSIEGMVTDPNGAAVKGATVTATSPNLITPQTAMTNDEGRYQILNLPPGPYKVSIEASGFSKFEKDNIAVNLGRTSSTDAQLQLATATATVTVTGVAAVDAAQNTSGR